MDMYNKKLQSAKYQFAQMQTHVNNQNGEELHYAVDAFVTIARSVLQYAYTEAEKTGKVSVYNGLVNGNSVFQYFRDLRNLNIHERPIVVTVRAQADLGGSVTVRRPDEEDTPSQAIPDEHSPKETTITGYYYDETDESEVIRWSETYLSKLETFIAAAKTKGLI